MKPMWIELSAGGELKEGRQDATHWPLFGDISREREEREPPAEVVQEEVLTRYLRPLHLLMQSYDTGFFLDLPLQLSLT